MGSEALELALALYRAPIQRHALHGMQLPHDIGIVIQLASAPQPLLHDVAGEINETENHVVEAARFYLQQALFQPDADAYRVLGVREDTAQERIREHYRWLQRWLHPDRRGEDWEALLATRVNWAWGHLRNDAARRAYAAECARLATEKSSDAHAFAPLPTGGWKTVSPRRRLGVWSKRMALGVSFGSCLGLLYLVLTQRDPISPDDIAAANSAATVPLPAGKPEARTGSAAAIGAQANSAVAAAGVREHNRGANAAPPTPPLTQLVVAAPPVSVPVVTPAKHSVAGERFVPAITRTLEQEAVTAAHPATVARYQAVAAKSEDRAVVAREHADVASLPAATLPATHYPGTAMRVMAGVAERQSEPPEDRPDGSRSGTPSAAVDEILAGAASVADRVSQTNATSAETTSDQPSSTGTLTQPESDVSVSSTDAVSRIDLARQRVRELALYFGRLDTPPPPVWNDASGEIGAEQQRSALHERARLRAEGDFEIDSLIWRMSENATAVSAAYHLRRGRSVTESGNFSLDMVWREKMWLVTRVELDPTP